MIIARTPLRISFLGGGSDYLEHFKENGGAVLGTAIDKYAYISAAPYLQAFHGFKYKLSYSSVEVVNSINEIKHPLIRESIRLACPNLELELHYIADLPARTGLGSSSSFLVAMLQALHGLQSNFVSAKQLADEAIDIERNILKEAGGYQDQIMAAYGGINLVEFSGNGKYSIHQLPISPERRNMMDQHCLILYTGIHRNSFEISMPQLQLTNEGKNAEPLNALVKLAREGADFLASDKPIAQFGEFLNQGWTLKKQLGDITLPEIDEAYSQALEHGAIGGKLLGAGKGGFILLWAAPENHSRIINGISRRMPQLKIKTGAPGATVIHSL